jgi:uncharacterized membrane protein (DUF2068 family)
MSQTHHAHASEHQVRSDSMPSVAHVRSMAGAARRPIGISMLALAAVSIGVAALLEAGAWFGAPDIDAGTLLATAASIIGPALVIAAIMEFIFAYGVWELRAWATRLGAGATITALLLTLLSAGRGSSGTHTLSLLLEVGTVWYLLRPRVQEAFRSHAGNGA